MIYYRVVPYETGQPLTPKFNSWQEADDYIFSFEPPIHAYITLIGEETNEEAKRNQPHV